MLFSVVILSTVAEPTAPSTTRVDGAASALFVLWWQANATRAQPGFFFSCGQIGKTGTSDWRQCACVKEPCENCYRWWDAVALEMLANRGLWIGGLPDPQHAAAARTTLAHAPYNSAWTGPCPFVDDFGWFLLAYARVYEWLGDDGFLAASEGLHDWVMTKQEAGTHGCGGITWQACGPKEGCACSKNSVTLLEVLIGSARLARLVPGKPRYLSVARELWDWFHTFDLFNDDGLVADGLTAADGKGDCCNATHAPVCESNKGSGFSYNQGLYLSAAAHLFNLTADPRYLSRTSRLMDAILENATDPSGTLLGETSGIQTREPEPTRKLEARQAADQMCMLWLTHALADAGFC